MTIPLATTTISVLRASLNANTDPTEASTARATVVSGVRAHLSSPSGSEQRNVGINASQEQVTYRLVADPCDLRHDDTVLDEMTSIVYEVTWAERLVGVSGKLDHVDAQIYAVKGQV